MKIDIQSKEIAKLQRENYRLKRALANEISCRNDVEVALMEIAEMAAMQDDALVEIAELVGG